MDPLVKVFPDVHDMVFQHWNATDFRKVTEVSSKWNEMIERSLAVMKKVKLDLKCLTEALKKFSSTRRYQNVSVNFWLHLTGDGMFRSFLEYLDQLGPVISLSLTHVLTLSEHEENLLLQKIDLSRMKILQLCFVSEDLSLVNELLNQCSSLTKLKLSHAKKRNYERLAATLPPSMSSLKRFLERNQSLQELELKGTNFFNLLFSDDISEIVRFKLKRLTVAGCNLPSSMSEGIEGNFLKFLVKQSQSLESFYIYSCSSDVIEHAFNKMPALTSLNIFLGFGAETLQLNLNSNILELGLFCINNSADFEKLFRAAPKVTTLTVRHLTPSKVDIASRNLPELRRLQFETCVCVNDQPAWFSLWPHSVEKDFSFDWCFPTYCSVEK